MDVSSRVQHSGQHRPARSRRAETSVASGRVHITRQISVPFTGRRHWVSSVCLLEVVFVCVLGDAPEGREADWLCRIPDAAPFLKEVLPPQSLNWRVLFTQISASYC